ncbi:STAS/SEC14 domain-containing protein [Arthrobacter liuii]|uniref:DUF7793 domain-containing protein n=2 Tax=Arthrobacter liuii TaxID=1476996 RepID=A0ABQ2B1U8_9MICC|nr:STAS/SEC14 domain-containing protein [Arthrobacter liuii]GGI03206.1 hypothetical protein GCM10007170_46650 [Arthrobacter liuii]
MCELYVDEVGIAQLKWHSDVTVGTQDAELAVRVVDEVCGAVERPLLVDMTCTRGVSRGARDVFGRSCQASKAALLVTSPVVEVIANFVLAMNKSDRPRRFFTSRDEAMKWLR